MSEQPRYIVYFKGRGYTAPNEQNPKGIRVTGSGYVIVDGPRPARAFDIPFEVFARCKQVFMEQCYCVRYADDEPGYESYPTVRLGKAL